MTEQAVDITRWNKKVDLILKSYGPVIKKIVDFGNSRVAASVAKNLSGMSPGMWTAKSGKQYVVSSAGYYPGKLPVRRITGTLARAYQVRNVTEYLSAHFINSKVARYAKHVHEGTRFLKPRPYFKNAFDSNKTAILNYWNYQFIKEMRRIGQA